MEWIFLVLILAFAFWSFQMIVVFKRQLARYESQIAQLAESTHQTRAEADRYAGDNEEKQKELLAVRDEAKAVEERETALKGRVEGMKQPEARGPTRYRVELPPNDA